MRVLILGSTGLLGARLAPFLKGKGLECITHGLSVPADLNFDVADACELHTALENVCPDVIINLVANTSVDECEEQPEKTFMTNAMVVNHLSRWLEDHDSHLIQISTDHFYDKASPLDDSREDEVILRNTYAFTKFAGELLASKDKSTILRTNFFGLIQHPTRESFSEWLYRNFVERKRINVFEDVYFSPLNIDTVCLAVYHVTMVKKYGVYNVGSREGLSKAEFARQFSSALRLDAPALKAVHDSSGYYQVARPKNMKMNSSRFSRDFDFLLPSLSEEIETMAANYV